MDTSVHSALACLVQTDPFGEAGNWVHGHTLARSVFFSAVSVRSEPAEPARVRKKSSMCNRYGPSCPWTCRHLNPMLYGSVMANHFPHFRMYWHLTFLPKRNLASLPTRLHFSKTTSVLPFIDHLDRPDLSNPFNLLLVAADRFSPCASQLLPSVPVSTSPTLFRPVWQFLLCIRY